MNPHPLLCVPPDSPLFPLPSAQPSDPSTCSLAPACRSPLTVPTPPYSSYIFAWLFPSLLLDLSSTASPGRPLVSIQLKGPPTGHSPIQQSVPPVLHALSLEMSLFIYAIKLYDSRGLRWFSLLQPQRLEQCLLLKGCPKTICRKKFSEEQTAEVPQALWGRKCHNCHEVVLPPSPASTFKRDKIPTQLSKSGFLLASQQVELLASGVPLGVPCCHLSPVASLFENSKPIQKLLNEPPPSPPPAYSGSSSYSTGVKYLLGLF